MNRNTGTSRKRTRRRRRVTPEDKLNPACQWATVCADPDASCDEKALLGTSNLRLCYKHACIVGTMVDYGPKGSTNGAIERLARALHHVTEDNRRLRERYGAAPDYPWKGYEDPPQPPKVVPIYGSIYAVRNSGNIKIGWTSNLERRMRQYPPDSVLLVSFSGTRKDEQRIHRRFKHLCVHGREWYGLSPQINEWVNLMRTEHGIPTQPDFAARATEVPRLEYKQPIKLRARTLRRPAGRRR